MNDYKFGNFICQLRTEKGLSQSQLGDMMGISNKAVSKWEMGVSKPRPAMLVALATLFGVTVEELLAGERNSEIKTEERAEKMDITVKLWAGEYLKKKKRGKFAVLTAVLLPIVFFVWVGIIVGINPTDKIFGPIGVMVILFAEAIDIALIFVFYGSARRLRRFLYATYFEQKEEIEAVISPQKAKEEFETVISPKKEKVPMLKWERICSIICASILALCQVIRLVVLCLGEKENLRIVNILFIIPVGLVCILQIIVAVHYYIRVYKLNKKK